MRRVNARRAAVTLSCFLGLLAAPAVAGAVEYPGGTTPTTVAERGDVLGENQDRGAVAGTDGAVSPAGAVRGESALPVTGGDLAGLAVGGLVLIGGGAVLVRRSRRSTTAAA
jgi:LPXTG-motif cell wall-anchored protein